MEQALSGTPTVLAGLTAGTSYTFQVKSSRPVWVAHLSSAPSDADDTEGAFYFEPFSHGVVSKKTGSEIYVWMAPGDGAGAIVYDEAA